MTRVFFYWAIQWLCGIVRKKYTMTEQIQRGLPRSAWEGVVIQENNEPMVELVETERLKLGSGFKGYQPSFFVRQTVAVKLYNAANRLPAGINMIVIEGHRSMENQQREWDIFSAKIEEKFPDYSQEEKEAIIKGFVALPNPLANHYCGGAVDVLLALDDGTLLDMGTPYISLVENIEDKKKFPMHSEFVSFKQRMNRSILRYAMEAEGFVWYPLEWWHFCFGDRMWAVYLNIKPCMYGPVTI